MLHEPTGKDVLVAGQKSGMVYALDPDKKGEILWQTRVGKGSTNGGVQWGMASDGQLIFAAVSDSEPEPGKIGTPMPVGNVNFDQTKGGGLTALRIADGTKAWFAAPHPCQPVKPGCSPAQPAAVTAIPGVVFSGSMDGHIRAFSAENGQVLWDFDTAKAYKTVNGVAAYGGSLDGAGPVVAGGMVYVNSGYPRTGGMRQTILLAFGTDDAPKRETTSSKRLVGSCRRERKRDRDLAFGFYRAAAQECLAVSPLADRADGCGIKYAGSAERLYRFYRSILIDHGV